MPTSLEVVLRVAPVALLVIITSAPLILDCDLSKTVPSMVPLAVAWPNVAEALVNNAKTAINANKVVLLIPPAFRVRIDLRERQTKSQNVPGKKRGAHTRNLDGQFHKAISFDLNWKSTDQEEPNVATSIPC